jgi:hypothetical protein
MSIHGLLFQWVSTNLIKRVQSGSHYHLIDCSFFSPSYSCNECFTKHQHPLIYIPMIFSRSTCSIILQKYINWWEKKCCQRCVLSGEATNTNFVVFDLTRSGLEPTIYRTRDEHVNHYTTDAILQFILQWQHLPTNIACPIFFFDIGQL